VVRAALRSLEYEEEDRAEKAAWLRQAIAEGEASGVARGDVFGQVKREARRIGYGKK
jgi:Arc/MetJ-type ribon-helix-helix transcriptional regulator